MGFNFTNELTKVGCINAQTLSLLMKILGTSVNETIHKKKLSCIDQNETDSQFDFSNEISDAKIFETSQSIFTYTTPFIILLGLIGNFLSVRVFLSKVMRKSSASYYLASLAISDIAVLITHVSVEWLQRSFEFNIINRNGVCQAFLSISYTFRFTSVWLIVAFTVERYMGICRPFKQREYNSCSFARRVILILLLTGCIISIFKPIISGYHSSLEELYKCSTKESYRVIGFALDSVYGLLITGFPFIIIMVLNSCIMKELYRAKRNRKNFKISSEENSLKLEFTFIMLIISSLFIALSIPYFVVWSIKSINHLRSVINHSDSVNIIQYRGHFIITKTVFYFVYSSNFVFYSLTGANFRQQLRKAFNCCISKETNQNFHFTKITKTVVLDKSISNSPHAHVQVNV